LLFLEHVAADGRPGRLKWQRRVEPVWKHLMGNCHLTRRTEAAIAAAGFEIERIQRESIRKALPIVRPSIRGIARKVSTFTLCRNDSTRRPWKIPARTG